MKWVGSMALGLALVGTSVQAATDGYGITGLINTPSADIVRGAQASFSYNQQENAQRAALTVALGAGLEAAVLRRVPEVGAQQTFGSFKMQLRSESVLQPAIAVGVDDVSDRHERSLYVAASKGLPYGLRLHTGIGSGRFHGFFAAIEKRLTPAIPSPSFQPFTALLAEYDGRHLNYGLRWQAAPAMQLDIGCRSKQTYMAVAYTFK